VMDKRDGLGLQNMNARIELLKGQVRIDSAAGEGTRIFIQIPTV
ncbi:MAG TPA: histidine kinase, partial [Chryseobacterium sp.]|nr:histidine kinase [Chryseobacterium sp.]